MHQRLREKSKPKKGGDQQSEGHAETLFEIAHIFPPVGHRSHERAAISAKHVDRRDHYAPKRQNGCDLKNVKTANFPASLERTEEHQDFRGKICEAWQADGGKGTETESKAGQRHR